MSAKISLDFRMETMRCYKCGVPYGMPDYFRARRLEDHEAFYCINGHAAHYPQENEAEKLQRELAETNKRLEFAKNEARSLQTQLATKNEELNQIKNRVSKGVCPCCRRSFVRLQQHMKTKHPDYADKK